MSDLIVSGTLLITGILMQTGGMGTYFQEPGLTSADIALMTAVWGMAEQGREFYCTDTHQWMGWNGTSLVIKG